MYKLFYTVCTAALLNSASMSVDIHIPQEQPTTFVDNNMQELTMPPEIQRIVNHKLFQELCQEIIVCRDEKPQIIAEFIQQFVQAQLDDALQNRSIAKRKNG